MVSVRCKLVVKTELEKLGLHYSRIELGEVVIIETLTTEQYDQLALALKKSGLELMDNKKTILIEKIKNIVIEAVHYSDEVKKSNISKLLARTLHYNYTYLANLFSEVEGTTISNFIIKHKIERIKELLIYDELTITEIAYRLQYSSVAHLSNQFKKVTDLTPSFFKKIKDSRRQALEDL